MSDGGSERSPPSEPSNLEPAVKPIALIVEDSPEMSRFLKAAMAREFQLVMASDGVEGLAKASEVVPDIVITDLSMPRMNGDEMTYALRERAEFERIPVIVLSGRDDEAVRLKLLKDGVEDYLLKPFSPQELVARARNLTKLKRAREVLQRELASRQGDVEALAKSLTHKKRELELALDAMRVSREQADRASQAKSTFLSLVSHELRTPLTNIQLQLDRFQRSAPLSDRQQGFLESLLASSLRLQRLVESILEYARLDTQRLTLRLGPCRVRDLAEEVVAELGPNARRKALELALEAPEVTFVSDYRLLRLVALNLLDNAIKYTERGTATLRVRPGAASIELEVADTGPGIAAEMLGRIFEPFEHAERTRNKHTPGLGLGLALVKGIVEALGGTIVVRSQLGVGTVFVVTVPEGDPAAVGIEPVAG